MHANNIINCRFHRTFSFCHPKETDVVGFIVPKVKRGKDGKPVFDAKGMPVTDGETLQFEKVSMPVLRLHRNHAPATIPNYAFVEYASAVSPANSRYNGKLLAKKFKTLKHLPYTASRPRAEGRNAPRFTMTSQPVRP